MFDNDRLRRRRLDMGLTLEEVGDVVGITRSAVQKYEKGVIKNIYTSTVELFSQALRCSPAYLLGWVDAPLEQLQMDISSSKEHLLLQNYRTLNAEGKAKIDCDIEDLMSIPKYTRASSTTANTAQSSTNFAKQLPSSNATMSYALPKGIQLNSEVANEITEAGLLKNRASQKSNN